MKNLLSIIKKGFLRKKTESIESSKSILEVVDLTTDERMKKAVESIRKYGQLTRWMQHNSDDIFEVAPETALYAVGIYRAPPTKPEIHYFNSKYTKKRLFNRFRNTPLGALDYMKQLAEKGETNTHLIYRHQKDVHMMLACG